MQKKLKANRPVKPRTTEALTLDQVKALLKGAQGEMQTLILLGATTGRPLRDLLELRWERVDNCADSPDSSARMNFQTVT
jgi:hypothetical protein